MDMADTDDEDDEEEEEEPQQQQQQQPMMQSSGSSSSSSATTPLMNTDGTANINQSGGENTQAFQVVFPRRSRVFVFA